ncbi:Uncharacterised protein [Mycobacteroides abscessus subsp. abscessus]|nr:Uncharacterised protein [Mycobacteroides abscessus subsp. abscessus]
MRSAVPGTVIAPETNSVCTSMITRAELPHSGATKSVTPQQ